MLDRYSLSLTFHNCSHRRQLKTLHGNSRLFMATQDFCIRCKEPVRARQEELQCNGCERWQHRTCGSGISQKDYRSAVKRGEEIDWRCEDCLNMSAGFLLPLAESTTTREVQEGKYFGDRNTKCMLFRARGCSATMQVQGCCG